jgi:hypothetical protein
MSQMVALAFDNQECLARTTCCWTSGGGACYNWPTRPPSSGKRGGKVRVKHLADLVDSGAFGA